MTHEIFYFMIDWGEIYLKTEGKTNKTCVEMRGRRAFRVLVEKPTVPQQFKALPKCYANQSLLKCSEELATGSCLYPHESNLFPILLL
jgi:hypothetical protein